MNRESSPPKRATLADVAALAGVSRATASLVLRDTGRLSDSTRERVRAAMDSLGYVYHRGAASLRARKTQSVGLIISGPSTGFTAEMSLAVESVMAEAGVVTLTANTLEDPKRQDLLIRSMIERQVDGLLVIPAIGSTAALMEGLGRLGVPAIVAVREFPHPGVSYIGIDNTQGGRLAGEHLLFHGVRRIAFLGGLAPIGPRKDRVRGISQALREADSDVVLDVDVPGPPHGRWGLQAASELLAAGDLPDGIVCHNDQVAFGVYRALRELAPESSKSVHIVSYDDVIEAALWEPPLTTIAASGNQVGIRCADVLLRHIDQPSAVERSLITPNLVVRESCGCPRKRRSPLAGVSSAAAGKQQTTRL